MPETPSTMLDLGTPLPSFSLPDFNGKVVSDADFKGSKALLVAFICKHCPFVRHIRSEFARFDKDQNVAKAFKAACTPDLFLFDSNRRLEYRGQFDGSRPKNNVPVNGADLRAAADAVLAGKAASENQRPSVGCNIKWYPGNEPEYVRTPAISVNR